MTKLTLLLVLLIGSCSGQDTVETNAFGGDLTAAQRYILLQSGTEGRYSSALIAEERDGSYVSWITGEELFRSEDKKSGPHPWPYFLASTDKVQLTAYEQGGREAVEKINGTHLGHWFPAYGAEPAYYCINGDALKFIPD